MGGSGSGGFALRTAISGIIGGTASEISGGKFSNGAVSGAFVHMFNDNFEKLFYQNKIYGGTYNERQENALDMTDTMSKGTGRLGVVLAGTRLPIVSQVGAGLLITSTSLSALKHLILIDLGKPDYIGMCFDTLNTLFIPNNTASYIAGEGFNFVRESGVNKK